MDKKLIESWFPVKEISRDAGIEMAYKSAPAYIKHARELGINKKIGRDFFDPKIRNLHPWFARRPCGVARAVTLASIFNESIDKESFMDLLGWTRKKEAYYQNKYPPLLFYTDPKREIIKNLLNNEGKNPEKIVICDPMAGGGSIPFESLRLGFRTIAIDYNPVAYIILKSTIEYPAKYGEKLLNSVKENAQKMINFAGKSLNEFYSDDAEGYIFARGIKCPKCNGDIPLIHDTEISNKYYVGFHFDKNEKKFNPYISKLMTTLTHVKDGKIVCPYCGFEIQKSEAYKIWTNNHVKILDDLIKGEFNKEKILSTHIILIKQTKEGYKIPDEKDIDLFLKACKKFSDSFEKIKSYLPMDEIPEENDVFSPVRKFGIKYWYQLFNPRQLLSLSYLIKFINEETKIIDAKDDIQKISMIYLALGVSRVIDYNSITTTWKKGTIRDTLGEYARNRKISYQESYCEAIVPRKNLQWIFETEFDKKTQGGIIPILSEICKRLDGAGNKITIIHSDARKLTSLIKDKLDLINVDPPYFDTHVYSDISEYFWQVLRLSLNDLIKNEFLFDNEKLDEWNISSNTVPRKGELIVRKNKNIKNNQNYFDERWYANQMMEFFKEAYNLLNDDGILIVWFTHRNLNAWKSIISALYGSNFYISKVWPITTELLTRLVAKNSDNTLDKTLIIVAKKKININIDMKEQAKKLTYEIVHSLKEIGTSKEEIKTFVYAVTMGSITVEPLQKDPINYCYSTLIPTSLKIANDIISEIMQTFWKEKNRLENYFEQ